ncbi:MAG: hypothetical protein J5486_11030 [Bacteroidaceae bacterium]|nr:hypothetical protein [Bacteroidaceae bacterium]
MKKYFNLLFVAVMAMTTSYFISCGDDGDDETKINLDDNQNENAITWNDSTQFKVDASFTPSLSNIQKTWVGEYTGWDAIQKKNTDITRTLVLRSNYTYVNQIVGTINDKKGLFESEYGTYTYKNGVVTYTCEVDSVLNYTDQNFNVYRAKHYYDHQSTTYTETARFTVSNHGKRDWITKDMYLQSLTAEKINLTFAMRQFDGDKGDKPNE